MIDLFRQWDDDESGKVEKAEFRRGMKELDPDVRTDGIDPEYARSVFEDLDVEMASAQASSHAAVSSQSRPERKIRTSVDLRNGKAPL